MNGKEEIELEEMEKRLRCAKHCLNERARQQYEQLLKEYDLKDIEGSL